MSSSESAEPIPRSRRSCIACRRRKIRCTRGKPCAYCTKFKLECTYPPGAEGPRAATGVGIATRLKRLEDSLQRIQPKTANDHNPEEAASRVTVDRPNNETEMCEGGDVLWPRRLIPEGDTVRYVADGFRQTLSETKQKSSSGGSASTEVHTLSSPMQGIDPFAVALHESAGATHTFHPEEIRIFGLWQVYLDSVDPLLKILHAPTVQRQLLAMSQNLTLIPPRFESLMFAIYYAAVTSLQASVSNETMSIDERASKLARYQSGLEQSLAKANMISAPDMMTLQALTLYLACARQNVDKAYIWPMVGLLVRLAMKIGLHRDPSSLNPKICTFDSEMRRRLWWHIYVLDIQTAEDNGMEPMICDHAYDTRYPANLNDDDLDVNMDRIPSPASSQTAMLFSLINFDISMNTRPLRAVAARNPEADRQILVDRFTKDLDDRFQGCDKKIPICFFARRILFLATTKLRMQLSPAASEVPPVDEWRPSNDGGTWLGFWIISEMQELRNDPNYSRYSRWMWLVQKDLEWDAASTVLSNLNMPDDGTAIDLPDGKMQVLAQFFEYWPSRVHDGDTRWLQLVEGWNRLVDKLAKMQDTQAHDSLVSVGVGASDAQA